MPERELYFDWSQSLTMKHSSEEHKTKMGDSDSGGANMVVKLAAGLNPSSDPTIQFVTQEEKRGTGYVWTCKCCQRTFTGHKRKLTIHIPGKKFLNDEEMGVRPCNPAVMIKQGD